MSTYRIESAKGTETFETIAAAGEWLERMQPAYAVMFSPASEADKAEGLDEVETDLASVAAIVDEGGAYDAEAFEAWASRMGL